MLFFFCDIRVFCYSIGVSDGFLFESKVWVLRLGFGRSIERSKW